MAYAPTPPNSSKSSVRGGSGTSSRAYSVSRAPAQKTSIPKSYLSTPRGRGELEDLQRNIANRPYDTSGLPGSADGLPDPTEFWLRTQAELAALTGGGGSGGGSSGGRGRRGGGGGRGGSGGGGGGGGGGSATDWAAVLAALAGPYDLANQQVRDRVAGARARVGTEAGVLNTAIGGQNKMVEQALAQRNAAIQQIMAQAQQQRAAFDQIARTDLGAQGVGVSGYNQVAGVEAGRLNNLGTAQKLYGADLDALARQGNVARTTYGTLSQQDANNNIGAAEQSALQQIALQRAQEEAKIRAQAAAQGVRI